MKIKADVIDKIEFCSGFNLNEGNDMVRVTLDIHKLDWARLKKHLIIEQLDKETIEMIKSFYK